MHCPSRRHRPTRAARLVGVALAWALLAGANPPWSLLAPSTHAPGRQTVDAATPPPSSPTPTPLVVPPPVDPHLASLSVAVAVNPDPVVVGQSATISVRVTNLATDPATGLSVLLPLPVGVTTTTPTTPLPALFAARAVAAGLPAEGWIWTPTLGGTASVTVTATVVVAQAPSGGALVLTPSVTVPGMPRPATVTGGALVVAANQTAATRAFAPGAETTLASADGAVSVLVPNVAATQPLMLTYSAQPPAGEAAPPPRAGAGRGFGTFHLSATDGAGNAVHQFAAPVTITQRYTPEQLRVLHLVEADLTFFTYDPTATFTLPSGQVQQGRWLALPTQVDAATHAARASVDHFTAFELGDNSAPSTAFTPSVKDWQTDLFTGRFGYAVPLDVPAGPNGIRPDLALRYDSGTTDGPNGMRDDRQEGWVGKGWSLDTGSITLQKTIAGSDAAYALIFGGKSYTFVPVLPPGVSPPPPNQLDQWNWHTSDESFLKIRAVALTDPTSTRGQYGTQNYQRYGWRIWTKDGTRYEFDDDSWWGWDLCAASNTAYAEPYKWNLKRVVDTHGNTITYTYRHETVSPGPICNGFNGAVDIASTLQGITWGANGANSGDHFYATFDLGYRQYDLQWSAATGQYGGLDGAPHTGLYLGAVRILSANDTPWIPIRSYSFAYTSTLTSDGLNSTNWKYGLHLLYRYGSDGQTTLPVITFTYAGGAGGGPRVADGANRLIGIDNGQGGVVGVGYQTIAEATGNDLLFGNYHRVYEVAQSDTTFDPNGTLIGAWQYAYENPELNTLGSQLAPADGDRNPWPNSARLYFNANAGGGIPEELVTQKQREFRGHKTVTVTDPNGHATKHWFYQGDEAACIPTATGQALLSDASCFLPMVTDEFEAGREYRSETWQGSADSTPPLTETMRTFGVTLQEWADWGVNALPGAWCLWVHLDSETETLGEGSGSPTPPARTTTYAYDPYGRVTTATAYPAPSATGTPLHRTAWLYATRDTATDYLIDRVARRDVYDGGGTAVARTLSYYDGSGTSGTVGVTGDLSRTTAFSDLAAGLGSDATYGYDPFGNRTTVTTYTGANLGGTARTTTTTYDPVFHDLPRSVTPPIAALATSATYDPVTRVLVTITDANGGVTRASYDLFGRLVTLTRPLADGGYPSLLVDYYDTEKPTRTLVRRQSANGWERTTTFTDGLGRPIETKRESAASTQNIVTQTRYDGTDIVTGVAQPHLVNETPNDTFYLYDAPNSSVLWTTTTTDALARPLVVTAPDGTTTATAYTQDGTGSVVTTTDANGHRTAQTTDLFGRLTTVVAFSGDGGSGGAYAPYATTAYQYDARDRLTTVTDTRGNQTRSTYDALGRRLTVVDPDLGTWQYHYDEAGNLTQQTDAKAQVTGFGYDALDRLVSRTGVDTQTTATFSYDAGADGAGQRTGMSNGAGQTAWTYDARGRVVSTTVSGVPGTTGSWTVGMSYDSADRLTGITHPTGETVAYAYDPAGRPTSACTSLGGCYASSATYSALDQPLGRTLGNGLSEQWGYTAPMQRLLRHQVGGLLDRSYGYDNVGNVTGITDWTARANDAQFSYDQRDRLTHACTLAATTPPTCAAGGSGGYDETDAYDPIGNLTSKGGVPYVYGSGHPHAPATVGGAAYTYDANGNVTSEGQFGRSYTWNALNLPTRITTTPPPPPTAPPSLSAGSRGGPTVAGAPTEAAASRGGPAVAGAPALSAPSRPQSAPTTESYTYDADGQRLTRTANGILTVYVNGIYEVDIESAVGRSEYTFAGGVLAERTTGGGRNTLLYLHSDHLGSVSVATSSTGAMLDKQEYTAWGAIRSGGVSETTRNYTGQQRDGTGLLYYGARYYDPVLGRFLSPDTSGIDFKNPQSLNRYAYVGNNPLNHTDPTGHCPDDAGCNDQYGNGGAAAFADLVQTIDQIPVAHDPTVAGIIADAEAAASGYHALVAPPGTDTGIGTGTGVRGAIALVSLLAALSGIDGGPFSGSSPSGSGQGSLPNLATTTPQDRKPNITLIASRRSSGSVGEWGC